MYKQSCVNVMPSRQKKKMHWSGIEPGPPAWQARTLPLNHQCSYMLTTIQCNRVQINALTSMYSSSPNKLNSCCRWTLRLRSSVEWTTTFIKFIHAIWKSVDTLRWSIKYWTRHSNLCLSLFSILKFSTASMTFAWPPLTRQTAARSSVTVMIVLH